VNTLNQAKPLQNRTKAFSVWLIQAFTRLPKDQGDFARAAYERVQRTAKDLFSIARDGDKKSLNH
jgi:hypothetical protein